MFFIDMQKPLGSLLDEFRAQAKLWSLERQKERIQELVTEMNYIQTKIGTPFDLGHCEQNLKSLKAQVAILEELVNFKPTSQNLVID